jgi:hypothetical protein
VIVDHVSLYSLAVVTYCESYPAQLSDLCDDARRDSLGCVSVPPEKMPRCGRVVPTNSQCSLSSSTSRTSPATVHGLGARVISSTCSIVLTEQQAHTASPKSRSMHVYRKVPRRNPPVPSGGSFGIQRVLLGIYVTFISVRNAAPNGVIRTFCEWLGAPRSAPCPNAR